MLLGHVTEHFSGACTSLRLNYLQPYNIVTLEKQAYDIITLEKQTYYIVTLEKQVIEYCT